MASRIRLIVLGLCLLAIGFLVGLGYSMVTLPEREDSPKLAEQAALREMQHVRGTLDEEIPALRNDVSELRRAMATLSARLAAQSSPSTTTLPPGTRELYHLAVVGDGQAPFVRDTGYTADPPNLERLAEIEAWSRDPAVRKKWLFTGERQVVATFGAPDEIHTDASGEWWIYWKKQGSEKSTFKYSLHVSAGRLVDASYFEDPDAKKSK